MYRSRTRGDGGGSDDDGGSSGRGQRVAAQLDLGVRSDIYGYFVLTKKLSDILITRDVLINLLDTSLFFTATELTELNSCICRIDG